MAATERPPSEQGVEYELLDALAEVKELLAQPTRIQVASPNWWDVLPGNEWVRSGDWREIFPVGQHYQFMLPNKRADMPVTMQVGFYDDRLEMTLKIAAAYVIWQRALFFQRPPG